MLMDLLFDPLQVGISFASGNVGSVMKFSSAHLLCYGCALFCIFALCEKKGEKGTTAAMGFRIGLNLVSRLHSLPQFRSGVDASAQSDSRLMDLLSQQNF